MSPVPAINPNPGDTFGNAIKTALATLTGVLHYTSTGQPRWAEYAPFTFDGDSNYRVGIILECDNTNLIYTQVQHWNGSAWTFVVNNGFSSTDQASFTCCQETWNTWTDLTIYPAAGSVHSETLTVTWTGNTCCFDGETCVENTATCYNSCFNSSFYSSNISCDCSCDLSGDWNAVGGDYNIIVHLTLDSNGCYSSAITSGDPLGPFSVGPWNPVYCNGVTIDETWTLEDCTFFRISSTDTWQKVV